MSAITLPEVPMSDGEFEQLVEKEMKTDWVRHRRYDEGDVIMVHGRTLRCLKAHTSDTFMLEVIAGRWRPEDGQR